MLFLSRYPLEKYAKEGMMIRVAAVDKIFSNTPRTYISYSLFSNLKKKIYQPAENVLFMELNVFRHGSLIIREIKKAPVIYIHSIFNCLPLYIFHFIIGSIYQQKQLVLDLHGIVPEELKFNGQMKAFWLYKKVERWSFKNIRKMIFVTKAMQLYMYKKYTTFEGNSLVFNIYPSVLEMPVSEDISENINQEKTVVIYSGNLTRWQNIDLMLDIIKMNISDKLEYIILTGEKELFEKELTLKGLRDNVTLLSVKPKDLPDYYKKANYGFVLRTDMPINNVANPTKLIEYLHFGIVPIVLSEKIGDFYNMGYEHVKVSEFTDQLPQLKSRKNQHIATAIKEQNQKADLYSFVMNA